MYMIKMWPEDQLFYILFRYTSILTLQCLFYQTFQVLPILNQNFSHYVVHYCDFFFPVFFKSLDIFVNIAFIFFSSN